MLTDVERVAPCLPGATLLSVDGDEFTGAVKVKVGPITVSYKGKATFQEKDEAAQRAVIKANGKETRGQGNAAATVTAQLKDEGDATTVVMTTDLTISGKAAQFGRGVLADVAGQLDRSVRRASGGRRTGRTLVAGRRVPPIKPRAAALEPAVRRPGNAAGNPSTCSRWWRCRWPSGSRRSRPGGAVGGSCAESRSPHVGQRIFKPPFAVMKPAAFAYHRPDSVEEAVQLLEEYGDDAKILAGGQSLVPMLAMRLTHLRQPRLTSRDWTS